MIIMIEEGGLDSELALASGAKSNDGSVTG
jgi:hypothetical protein